VDTMERPRSRASHPTEPLSSLRFPGPPHPSGLTCCGGRWSPYDKVYRWGRS
jgi:hypothetical protein